MLWPCRISASTNSSRADLGPDDAPTTLVERVCCCVSARQLESRLTLMPLSRNDRISPSRFFISQDRSLGFELNDTLRLLSE